MRNLIFIATLFFIVEATAQDTHFAQLSETPQIINPALTGMYDGLYRGIINYRNQWPSMGKAFSTVMCSFDMPIEKKKQKGSFIGLGGFFYSDKGGDSRFGTTQGKISISSIVPVNSNGKFSAGLQAGMMQHSINLTGIEWPNQYNGYNYDPGLNPNEQLYKNSFSYLDLGVGMSYESVTSVSNINGINVKKINFGAAYYHASMPVQKFYTGTKERQYAKVVAHGSMRKDIEGTRFGIVPSLLFMMQGPAMEIYGGGLVRIKTSQGTKVTNFFAESAFSFGLFYRFKDALSPQVYYEMGDYSFGLSYDFNASSYGQVQRSAGGLEISIKYANMHGALRKGI